MSSPRPVPRTAAGFSRVSLGNETNNNNNNNNNRDVMSAGSGAKSNEHGITVVVRVRPLSDREKDGGETIVSVDRDGKTLFLHNRQANGGDGSSSHVASFIFDHVISSLAPSVEVDLPLVRSSNDDKEEGGGEKEKDERHHLPPLSRNNYSSPKKQQQQQIEGDHKKKINGEGGDVEMEQRRAFKVLGAPVVDWALRGFNACVFAYGQTNSGKTHTMIGTANSEGIVPRVCRLLFSRIKENMEDSQQEHKQQRQTEQRQCMLPRIQQDFVSSPAWSQCGLSTGSKSDVGKGRTPSPSPTISSKTPVSNHHASACPTRVVISFMEIYNEKVQDLLKPSRGDNVLPHYNSRFNSDPSDVFQPLKVRQHPLHGPFVEGLTTVQVRNWEECSEYIKRGNAMKTQASTLYNEASSRSHVIFQIIITHTLFHGGRVRGKEVSTQCTSKINLVDLAGSERASHANINNNNNNNNINNNNRQCVETNSINLSLSVLRRVITSLIQHQKTVPYRESLLTYILSDNFGGNSHTVMCATISPHVSMYTETESTLRYAALTRGVINRIKINKHPLAELVDELKEHIKILQEKLYNQTSEEKQNHLLKELHEREEELLGLLRNKEMENKLLKEKAEQETREKKKVTRTLRYIIKKKPELMEEENITIPTYGSETESETSIQGFPPPKRANSIKPMIVKAKKKVAVETEENNNNNNNNKEEEEEECSEKKPTPFSRRVSYHLHHIQNNNEQGKRRPSQSRVIINEPRLPCSPAGRPVGAVRPLSLLQEVYDNHDDRSSPRGSASCVNTSATASPVRRLPLKKPHSLGSINNNNNGGESDSRMFSLPTSSAPSPLERRIKKIFRRQVHGGHDAEKQQEQEQQSSFKKNKPPPLHVPDLLDKRCCQPQSIIKNKKVLKA